jgi:4-hydroxy-3-polyprenylbenzoate decarboxylase
MRRIVVGVTGASGSVYGVRLLEHLQKLPEVESHLIVTRAGEKTLYQETGLKLNEIKEMATHWHAVEEIGASIASGSYPVDGMVIAPCSINTLSAIASGLTSNLLIRAADVALKERRRLILMVRECPLHLGHLRSMVAVTEIGAIVAPPLPAFYNKPQTLEEAVDQSVFRVLDLLGIPESGVKRWQGC